MALRGRSVSPSLPSSLSSCRGLETDSLSFSRSNSAFFKVADASKISKRKKQEKIVPLFDKVRFSLPLPFSHSSFRLSSNPKHLSLTSFPLPSLPSPSLHRSTPNPTSGESRGLRNPPGRVRRSVKTFLFERSRGGSVGLGSRRRLLVIFCFRTIRFCFRAPFCLVSVRLLRVFGPFQNLNAFVTL